MKHLPNILTLCNLFCGCLAISNILTAQPHLITTNGGADYFPIMGSNNLVYGSLFIVLAAIFDVFDGLAARALNASSPIGKDLDSLADVVSFGVAPSMIIYQMLWMASMSAPKAMSANPYLIAMAFIIPCFGALRLARFNQDNKAQSMFFRGMPIPAVGIFVSLLPLVIFYQNQGIMPNVNAQVATLIQNKWVIIAIAVILSLLMVSNNSFLKWKAPAKGIGAWWAHIVIVLTGIIGYLLIGFSGLLIAFVVYIIVSLLYKYPSPKPAEA